MESCVGDVNFIKLGLSRRKELLEKKDFERLEELYQSQGKIFGKILLDQMSPLAKILLKSDVEQKIPNENIYVAPVDRVLEIIDPCRSPCRVNANHIDLLKATTFDYILKEGTKLEKKIAEKNSLKMTQAIQENSDFERFEADNRLRYALREQEEINSKKFERFRLKVQVKFQEKIEHLEKFYDKKYNKMLQDVVQDSTDRIEVLHLTLQRQIEDLLIKLEEAQKAKIEIESKEMTDKTTNVDLVSADIRKYEEQNFKDTYARDTEKSATILNFVSTMRNEFKSKSDQMKQDFLNTLSMLKDSVNRIIECFCSYKTHIQNKHIEKCPSIIRNFRDICESALQSIGNFEAKYRVNFCQFLKKPLCTFVIPSHISNKIICDCYISSSDTEELECECKLTPKLITQSEYVVLKTQPTYDLKEPNVNLHPLENYKDTKFSLDFIDLKQKLVDEINMPQIINKALDACVKDLIERSSEITETKELIQSTILDLIQSRVSCVLFNHDFAWLDIIKNSKYTKNVGSPAICEDELVGAQHYFFDHKNRTNLPKYLIGEHGNKTYVYSELTKDELISIYKKNVTKDD